MSIWNCAHNVGGAARSVRWPLSVWFGSARGKPGTFWFPAIVALFIVVISFLLIRDTPQSCGLPPIEEFGGTITRRITARNQEEVLTTREIFFKYVLNNKTLWFIAIANAFVYLVRYGRTGLGPDLLEGGARDFDIKECRLGLFRLRVCGHSRARLFAGG